MRFPSRWLGVASCVSMLVATGIAQARDWSAIKASGTMIVATEGVFFPFNYFDGPNLTGFEVELAEAVDFADPHYCTGGMIAATCRA